MNSKLNIP